MLPISLVSDTGLRMRSCVPGAGMVAVKVGVQVGVRVGVKLGVTVAVYVAVFVGSGVTVAV